MSSESFNPQGHMPSHVAFIMDGNRRWARKRLLPTIAGHRSALSRLNPLVRECQRLGIQYVTFYAFSSENWLRPQDQVRELMDLFYETLKEKIQEIHENKVCIHFAGDRQRLEPRLVRLMEYSEDLTRDNTAIHLVIALNYGGRWDITQAVRQVCQDYAQQGRALSELTEQDIGRYLSTSGMPDPDLLVRTSGECRISNFLLWQMAYTEMYFTETFWPDFDVPHLHQALAIYQTRERRFGADRA